jgi:outer membrane protein OmpA-like peptidoglycan-associated protein
MRNTQWIRALCTIALVAGGGAASAQDRFNDGPRGERDDRLIGAGVPDLLPELRRTPRGRAFVMRNFDLNRDGRVSPREARAANRAFANAGPRHIDEQGGPDRVVVVERDGGWDRGAMRGYRFRQTAEGARMTMQEEVLFATDSDVLRPGAIERLRPLAGYLRANPGVRVAIDGHTDSRGTDAHNQDLSERRAASVREALDDMGVVRARFRVRGHGESSPVASNATVEGMRLNRRVEVTLLGRRADEF